MTTFKAQTDLPVSTSEAFRWLTRPGAFERLKPPWEELIGHDGRVERMSGPFASWTHGHGFLPEGEDRCVLEDTVEYRLRPACFWGCTATRRLERLFRFRHATILNDLVRHKRFADRKPLRIAVSGASGLVGSSLCSFLTAGGHGVSPLVRRRAEQEAGEIEWNPAKGTVDSDALEGYDAVVHLAGENVGAGRWSADRKQAILSSRVQGTNHLCQALAGLKQKPDLLISASAIGYYGNRGDDWVEESATCGEGFLAEVARQWETATEPARKAGIRVIHLRIGVVLTPAGGALARMLTPFRLGLGGRAGDGKQYMSWIALDDLVGAIHHLLLTPGIEGSVNAVAPEPETNAAFSRTLGRVLRRPAMLPLPAPAIHLLLGEMGRSLLLEGVRVRPTGLLSSGFDFLHPRLDGALRAGLGY